jgi:hypothetical protein
VNLCKSSLEFLKDKLFALGKRVVSKVHRFCELEFLSVKLKKDNSKLNKIIF